MGDARDVKPLARAGSAVNIRQKAGYQRYPANNSDLYVGKA